MRCHDCQHCSYHADWGRANGVVRCGSCAAAEIERLQAERDIAWRVLADIDVIERGTRKECADYVREHVRDALDNAEWLKEHTEQFCSDAQILMEVWASHERLRAIVDKLRADLSSAHKALSELPELNMSDYTEDDDVSKLNDGVDDVCCSLETVLAEAAEDGGVPGEEIDAILQEKKPNMSGSSNTRPGST